MVNNTENQTFSEILNQELGWIANTQEQRDTFKFVRLLLKYVEIKFSQRLYLPRIHKEQ